MYWSDSPLNMHHYVAIKSTQEIENAKINLYLHRTEKNIWYERLQNVCSIVDFDINDFRDLKPLDFLDKKFFDNMVDILTGDISSSGLAHTIISDIFRCLIIYVNGGFYSDLDIVYVNSVKDLTRNYSLVLPTCQDATNIFDKELNKFVQISSFIESHPELKLSQITNDKFKFSHLSNGNLGGVKGHSYFRNMLIRYQSLMSHKRYAKSYNLDLWMEEYENDKNNKDHKTYLAPWYVFHSIFYRYFNKLDHIPGNHHRSINPSLFFEGPAYDIDPDFKVFHYWGSKTHKFLQRRTQLTDLYKIDSTYNRLALKYLEKI